jgi:hypothetical protein
MDCGGQTKYDNSQCRRRGRGNRPASLKECLFQSSFLVPRPPVVYRLTSVPSHSPSQRAAAFGRSANPPFLIVQRGSESMNARP